MSDAAPDPTESLVTLAALQRVTLRQDVAELRRALTLPALSARAARLAARAPTASGLALVVAGAALVSLKARNPRMPPPAPSKVRTAAPFGAALAAAGLGALAGALLPVRRDDPSYLRPDGTTQDPPRPNP